MKARVISPIVADGPQRHLWSAEVIAWRGALRRKIQLRHQREVETRGAFRKLVIWWRTEREFRGEWKKQAPSIQNLY